MHTRTFLKMLAGTGAAAALGTLAGCSKAPPPGPAFQAVDVSGADYAKGFSLPDAQGRVRTLTEFKGKVVAIFFGFTQCPDVCPTTLAEMAEVKRALGPDGDRLQTIFITVDPARDTPEILSAYMANFDPGFIALRPSPEQLTAVAKDFKVYFKRVDGSAPGSYSMDHSAATYLYDPQGRLRLYARYGGGAKPLLADIRQLLAESPAA